MHCVGKWDLGMHKWEYTPTYRGFDTFFGYYNAVEDYYDHSFGDADNRKFNAVDFRNNTKPVTDKNGTYSTMLFTEAVEQIIMNHDSDKGPFFIYAAYQSIHYPIEAPQNTLMNAPVFLMITNVHFVGCCEQLMRE
ncbi:arylsulfatase B-like [Dysidea avara]|uniref:arylsulfatase B-like n=1 Tax=Dysidea avara TaxID=196820 RepID=UPI00331AFFFD